MLQCSFGSWYQVNAEHFNYNTMFKYSIESIASIYKTCAHFYLCIHIPSPLIDQCSTHTLIYQRGWDMYEKVKHTIWLHNTLLINLFCSKGTKQVLEQQCMVIGMSCFYLVSCTKEDYFCTYTIAWSNTKSMIHFTSRVIWTVPLVRRADSGLSTMPSPAYGLQLPSPIPSGLQQMGTGQSARTVLPSAVGFSHYHSFTGTLTTLPYRRTPVVMM